MSHHDCRRGPAQITVRVAVQMYDVRLILALQREQPLAGPIDVAPWSFHPLQLVRALDELHVAARMRLGALVRRWPRSHCGEDDLNAVRLQSVRELDRVRPHATD